MDSLSTWLEGIGLERYGQVFAENGVDLNYADEFAAILGKKPAVATGIPGLPRPTAICVTSIASDPRAPVAQRSIPRTCLMGLREDRIGRGEIGHRHLVIRSGPRAYARRIDGAARSSIGQ